MSKMTPATTNAIPEKTRQLVANSTPAVNKVGNHWLDNLCKSWN